MNIKIVHTVDPVVDPRGAGSEFKPYVCQFGTEKGTFYRKTSETSANNTDCSFTINYSDKKTALDPSSIIMEMPITIVKVGALGINPYVANAEGFASRPLERICKTFSKQMDGVTDTLELSRIVDAVEAMDEVVLDDADINDDLKMMDKCQDYFNVWGTNSSPFAIPQDNTTQPNRRNHPFTVTYDGVNTATITSTLYMSFNFAPLTSKPSFPLCTDNLTFNLIWDSGYLNRVWRVDAINHTQPGIVPSVTLGQPILHYRLNQLPFGWQCPRDEIYPIRRVVRRTSNQTSAPVAAGATDSLLSQAYELGQVPSLIICLVKMAQADYTSLLTTTKADSFASILGVDVQFGNDTRVFSNASQYELYKMSRHRGLSSSYSYGHWVGQFGGEVAGVSSSGKGSVFIFSPILDIGSTSNLLTNGVAMKNLFQISVNFRNMSTAATRFELQVIEIYDNIIKVENNLGSIRDTVIPSAEMAIASQGIPFPDELVRGGSVSSFFKGLLNVGKKVFGFLNPIAKQTKLLSTMSKFIPYVGPAVSTGLNVMGYGEGEGDANVPAGTCAGARDVGMYRDLIARNPQKKFLKKKKLIDNFDKSNKSNKSDKSDKSDISNLLSQLR